MDYLTHSHFYPYIAPMLLADSVHCQDVLITGNLWPYEPAVKRTVPNGPTDVDNWLLKYCARDTNGNMVLHAYSIEEYVQLFEFHLDPAFWNYVYQFLQYTEMDYPLGEKLFEVELKDEEQLEAARQYVEQPPLRPIVGPQAGAIGFWQLLNGRFVDKKKEELPIGVWSKWYRG